MVQNMESGVAELYGSLTEHACSFREDILRLTLVGVARSDIAERLSLTNKEVAEEQARIYQQAGVDDRTGLFLKLIESVV